MTGQIPKTSPAPQPLPKSSFGSGNKFFLRAEMEGSRSEVQGTPDIDPEELEAVFAAARRKIEKCLESFLGNEKAWLVRDVIDEIGKLFKKGGFNPTAAIQDLQSRLYPLSEEAKRLVAEFLQMLEDVMRSRQPNPIQPKSTETGQPPMALTA